MQLIAFIHDIGRDFQEHRREDFLERLKSVGNKAGKALSESEAKDIDFDEMYSHIRDNLKCIDSQEVAITGILNEEYDDWNDDSGEEFYYEDNSGISEMLEEACDFVHVCMDREKYKEGAATFDCRVVPLPNKDRVADYFVWRQEDAHRNSLNAHCYWALRKEGISQNAATMELEGKTVAFKNELLFQKGINYNELPSWQKRGIGVYLTDIQKEGFNPVKKEKVITQRRELFVDYEIPLGEDYREFVLRFLDED